MVGFLHGTSINIFQTAAGTWLDRSWIFSTGNCHTICPANNHISVVVEKGDFGSQYDDEKEGHVNESIQL